MAALWSWATWRILVPEHFPWCTARSVRPDENSGSLSQREGSIWAEFLSDGSSALQTSEELQRQFIGQEHGGAHGKAPDGVDWRSTEEDLYTGRSDIKTLKPSNLQMDFLKKKITFKLNLYSFKTMSRRLASLLGKSHSPIFYLQSLTEARGILWLLRNDRGRNICIILIYKEIY